MDDSHWISCKPNFLLPVRVLSKLFRRLMLKKLLAAHQAGSLRVSRWSKPGRGDARPNGYSAALSSAQSSPKAIVIAAQVSPRPTSAGHHLTATLSRLTPTLNTAIKSP
jgi:putative transposase